MEEWRDIKDFPGYQVSDKGNIRSRINNRHGLGKDYHEISPCLNDKQGHKSVQLGRDNRRSVHRLVAEAFIPNPNNYPLVRHLDDDPSNNNVDNLAWGTQRDNMQDCVKHGRLVGDTTAAINSRRKRVVAIPKNGGSPKEFCSVQEAARQLDVWPQHICSVIQGKISQTGGWIFKYAEGVDQHE